MELRKKTGILLILSIIWTVLIFVLCILPPHNLPKTRLLHLDKAAHFGFFFIQSALVSLVLHYKTKKSFFQIIFLSTIQAFVYGGIIEILQNEFFNRTGDFYDLLADVVGGFFGAIASRFVLKNNT